MNKLINTYKKLFKRDYHPYVSVSTYRYGLIVTFSLFLFFGLIDYLVINDEKALTYTLIVRFLFIVPVYIISYLLTYHKLFKLWQPVLSFVLGLCSLAALVGMLHFAKISHQDNYDLYFTAFVLAISFAPLVLWYNKIFMFLSLIFVLVLFNVTSIYFNPDEINVTYIFLQNVLMITGGILGSYCRYFVMNILRWNIHKTGIITQRRHLLEQAHKKLETSDNMKRLLLSILSHDIRGPLNNVQTILHFLSQGIVSPQEFNNHSKQLNDQLAHTQGILDNVLLWSKSEMNMASEHEIMPLHRIVSENMTSSETEAMDKNIVFHNNVDPTLIYHGDLNIVRLVLRNLLANAIKFTENGRIVVYSNQEDDKITIAVKDDGIGMDKYEASLLFNPEKQFTKDGTRSEKGTGVGLMICHEVVKKYGGTLSVETEKRKGTTFYFTLPTVRNTSINNSETDGENMIRNLDSAVKLA